MWPVAHRRREQSQNGSYRSLQAMLIESKAICCLTKREQILSVCAHEAVRLSPTPFFPEGIPICQECGSFLDLIGRCWLCLKIGYGNDSETNPG
jgi:hypothetical protein